jgi:hypothetical protein
MRVARVIGDAVVHQDAQAVAGKPGG